MARDEALLREQRRQARQAARAAARPARARQGEADSGINAAAETARAVTALSPAATSEIREIAPPAKAPEQRDTLAAGNTSAGEAPRADEPSTGASVGPVEPESKAAGAAEAITEPEHAQTHDPAIKPAAIAQVLGRTEASRSFDTPIEPLANEDDAAIGDFIRSPSHARDDIGPSDTTAERPRAPMLPLTNRLRSEHRSWTNEPVMFAILLVALLVLVIDSYFMIRLNGLSDRLDALSATASATPAPVNDRPWVGTDTITTANFSNGGQPVTTLHLVNSGHTPATDLRSNTVGSLRTASAPPPDIPTKPGPLATTGMLLPNTGGKLTFFANTRALTADEAASVKAGKYVLWLAGRLDYRDKSGHVHTTTFRYRFNPAVGSFVAAPNGNSIN